jgi:hypothetical protein
VDWQGTGRWHLEWEMDAWPTLLFAGSSRPTKCRSAPIQTGPTAPSDTYPVTIYSVRHIEMSSKEAKMRRDTFNAIRRKRTATRSRTIFAAWNIPYCRPTKRRLQHIDPTLNPRLHSSKLLLLTQWPGRNTPSHGHLQWRHPTPEPPDDTRRKPASETNIEQANLNYAN